MKTSQKPGGEVLFLAVLLIGMGLLVTIGVIEMVTTATKSKAVTRSGSKK